MSPESRHLLNKLQSQSPLESWLEKLEDYGQPASHELISGNSYKLYGLVAEPGGIRVEQYKAYLKKDRMWGKIKRVNTYQSYTYNYSYSNNSYLLPEDEEIGHLLDALDEAGEDYLHGETGGLVLRQILATGRTYLADPLRQLHQGEPLTPLFQWQALDDGFQLEAQLAGVENWQLIPTTPPYYISTNEQTIGPLILNLEISLFSLLTTMPQVPEDEMVRVSALLRGHFTRDTLPLPSEPNLVIVDTPTPHITLLTIPSEQNVYYPGLTLQWEYGTETITLDEGPSDGRQIIREANGRQLVIKRNIELENQHLNILEANMLYLVGGFPAEANFWIAEGDTGTACIKNWQAFEHEVIPRLQQQGWLVTKDHNFNLPTTDVTLHMTLQDKDKGWFDFALEFYIDDRRLNTSSLVEQWLNEGTTDFLMMPTTEGDWVRVDTRPLATIRALIEELFSREQLAKPARLANFQAARFPDLEVLNTDGAPRTGELLKKLADFNGLTSITPPPDLNAQLRPYQQQGLDWLGFLQQYEFGGILADDMGLGKTLQTLALLLHMKAQRQLDRPALVIAPTSLMGNWLREAARFAPSLTVTLIHGPDRNDSFKLIKRSDLVVTSYPLLLRDHSRYKNHRFSLLVLDEAQAIKNSKTKIASQVRKLNAQTRLCLTGTPLENHLGELWALMDFVLPGLLGSERQFGELFRRPIEENGDTQRKTELARRLAPFMLRRTKAEVVTELPEKTEIVQHIELEGKQRQLYESIRVSMEKRIRDLLREKGMARSHIEFLDALLKLRQACIDPRLVKLDQAAGIDDHAKLDWLAENLPQMLEEGRRILLFSQFTEALGLVEDLVKGLDIPYAKLTGKTRKRDEAIDKFQLGDARLFLISLKAGGSGLNLTAADTVIHIDPWWNPAVENQATDRAHRIGQDKPVFVYKLVAMDTVEERIQEMQKQKQALADSLFDETRNAGLPNDQEALLALLR